jgi:Leucine-rich repeat (LRR) protein
MLLSVGGWQAMTLTRVDLSHNKLSSIDASWGRCLVAVTHLNMSHNVIFHIDDDAFDHMSCLSELVLSHNALDDATGDKLPRLLTCTVGLKTLDLANNQLRRMRKVSRLVNAPLLPELERLVVRANRLVEVEPGALVTGLGGLKKLDMSDNGLGELSEAVLRGCLQLEELTLSRNLLTELTPGTYNYARLVAITAD